MTSEMEMDDQELRLFAELLKTILEGDYRDDCFTEVEYSEQSVALCNRIESRNSHGTEPEEVFDPSRTSPLSIINCGLLHYLSHKALPILAMPTKRHPAKEQRCLTCVCG